MTTSAMSPDQQTHPRAVRPIRENAADRSVQQIIAAARATPRSSWSVWMLSGLTGVLLWASFRPLDWGPLGWVAMVPLILLVRLQCRPRWMYVAVFTAGFASNLAILQWMRLGDPAMYAAWVLLTFCIAVFFPLFLGLSRVAVHRYSIPLTLAVPTVWVGLEYVRAHLMTGFAWYYLGHTQYRWVELIQISDLFGAYGVSFLVVLTSACLAGLLPTSLLARLKLLPPDAESSIFDDRGASRRQMLSVACCLTVFAASLVYGYVRRSQAEFREGPRVAIIQGNFTTSLKRDPSEWGRLFRRHHSLTGQAVKHQPDLIVWPETMFRWPLYEFQPGMSDEDLRRVAPEVRVENWRDPSVKSTLTDVSQQSGAAMVVGIESFVASKRQFHHFNSAAFIRPDVGLNGRYDKIHRVPFGEYIPLREQVPWLYRFTPFPRNFGIDAGERAIAFDYHQWRFAPIICFEDTVPHLVRRIINATDDSASGGKGVDFLVNVTNDGWFHGSSELDQHLITALFRCIECRTPMVRAVNTGISAFIDGDGIVVEPDVFVDGDRKGRDSMRDPKTGRWHKQLNAVLIDTVPLDDRTSAYLAAGDWFAGSCGFCTLMLLMGGLLPRRKKRKAPPEQVATL